MTRTYHTHGNAQSWRSRGYQDRPRVPGPITPMDTPRATLWQRIKEIAR